MSAVALQSAPSFAERLAKFIETVDIRRADTDDDREAIFRLRYDAYLREGTIAPEFGRRFADRFDDSENVWTFGLRYEGVLVSSFRLHVVTDQFPESPAVDVFPDLLMPELKAGKIIIDPTRFVADAAASRRFPELPYATVRLGFLASEYFDADLCLATVRVEHQAYYRRLFMARPVCEPRMYPSLKRPISLMVVDFQALRGQILRRYPAMESTEAERVRLFGGAVNAEGVGIKSGPRRFIRPAVAAQRV